MTLENGVLTFRVDKIYPEWNSLDAEHVETLLTVFTSDALKSSHPISVNIEKPSDISQIFDTISYKKGCYLLRMMNLFLGKEVFKAGVSNYLKEHEYGNAEQDDLWLSLTTEAHKQEALPKNLSIKKIMDTWTLQTGYPVITVTRDYETGTATITQKRFLSYINEKKAPGEEPCWVIPLSYTSQKEADFNNARPKDWAMCKEPTQISGLPGGDQWVIFNIRITGLYRVKYDERNLALISKTLNSDQFKSISLLNRVQIVADTLSLASIGEMEYPIAIEILRYLQQESEYGPWRAAISNLDGLSRILRRTSDFGSFRNYMIKLLTPLYTKIGNIANFPNTTDIQKLKFHNLVTAWACRLHMGDCVEQASNLYRNWMSVSDPDSENPVPRDIRPQVYCSAIKHGGEQEWDFAWQRYLKSNVGTEKIVILSQLGCTRELWLLRRYLEWTLTEDFGIRRQDSWIAFMSIARNEIGFQVAKEFLMQRIADIHKFTPGSVCDHCPSAVALHAQFDDLPSLSAQEACYGPKGSPDRTSYYHFN